MKKENMVTRRFAITTGVVMMIDLSTSVTCNVNFKVVGDFKGDELLKVVKNLYEIQGVKAVAIVSSHTAVKRYTMTVNDFIQNALELPLR